MHLAILVLLFGCLVGHVYPQGVYNDRFLQQYERIHNPSNGYFSSEGIPYHSVETLMVEAPDHGHQTTSESYSYYIWLEAMYGAISGNFGTFNEAWNIMERYIIPSSADQPTNSFYNPSAPATFAAELDSTSEYPSPMEPNIPVGVDMLFQELQTAYGNPDVYGMHWIQDVDNVYGFGNVAGNCEGGPGTSGPSNFNTYQRGPEESVWRTIPQPTCDSFKYGGTHGFLDLFVQDQNYAHQWKFTAAPDADARAVQAAYWALIWAREAGQESSISATIEKAAKLGDYLRYALFDKYFKQIGDCFSKTGCPGGDWNKNSAHYLISWYYAWGGALDTSAGWAWRIGDGASHFGYQNPLAAYALANEPALKPKSQTGADDWAMSLQRQLQFYQWLQTVEGPFAGGATNSWNGRYDQPPSNLSQNTFYGMTYDWEPVYHDPPSNRWYGMQGWSTDRLAQYYYVTEDSTAKFILDKWVAWIVAEVQFDGDGYQIPGTLDWSGVPERYEGGDTAPAPNPNLHVTITGYTTDVGIAAATARTLAYYAARAGDAEAKNVAKELLDRMWNLYQSDKGVAAEEERADYTRFNEPVYVPPGWTGTYPNGDVIDSAATFISIRSFYRDDPDWPQVEAYLNGGPVPVFTYHRFWQQAEVALANGAYGLLFNE